MAQITIGALDVPVTPGTSYEVQQQGDVGRAFSSKMRSDIRGHARVFRVTTPPILIAAANTLVAALEGTQPLSGSGDLIGTAANFHARSIRVQPLSATHQAVSFELHETDAT